MHLVGETQRRGKKQRLGVEQAFKRVNTFILAVNLGCYLLVLSQCTIAAGKTFAVDFWFPKGPFKLDPLLHSKTVNCSQTISAAGGGWSAFPQTISGTTDRDYRFAVYGGKLRQSLVINGVMVFVGALNKLMFDLNIFELRIAPHFSLRKELWTALEFLFIIFSLSSAIIIEPDAQVLRNFLENCGMTTHSTLPYSVPFIPIFVSIAVTLFAHMVSFAILLQNATRELPKKGFADIIMIHPPPAAPEYHQDGQMPQQQR